jgi:hypothetical protein
MVHPAISITVIDDIVLGNGAESPSFALLLIQAVPPPDSMET